MIAFTATVTKQAEIRDWARRMPTDFGRRAVKLVTVHALAIERTAKRLAPVAANILKPSIHTDLRVSGNHIGARIGTDVKHGAYQEFGTGLYGYKHHTYVIEPKKPGGVLVFGPMRAGTSLKTGQALYRAKGGGGKAVAQTIHFGEQGVYLGRKVCRSGRTMGTRGAAGQRQVSGQARGTTINPTRMTTRRSSASMTFATRVIHPGVHPQPFLGPAFDHQLPLFRRDLQQLARLRFPR